MTFRNLRSTDQSRFLRSNLPCVSWNMFTPFARLAELCSWQSWSSRSFENLVAQGKVRRVSSCGIDQHLNAHQHESRAGTVILLLRDMLRAIVMSCLHVTARFTNLSNPLQQSTVTALSHCSRCRFMSNEFKQSNAPAQSLAARHCAILHPELRHIAQTRQASAKVIKDKPQSVCLPSLCVFCNAIHHAAISRH